MKVVLGNGASSWLKVPWLQPLEGLPSVLLRLELPRLPASLTFLLCLLLFLTLREQVGRKGRETQEGRGGEGEKDTEGGGCIIYIRSKSRPLPLLSICRELV